MIVLYNPFGSAVAMPAPFRGVLPPGGRIALGLEESEFYATIGNEGTLDGLRVEAHPQTWETPASHAPVVPHTIHFNVGKIGIPDIAGVPGTPDSNAMAIFGQLNISDSSRIAVSHMHLTEDGSTGSATAELYRRRDGVFTLLGTVTQNAGAGDFSTVAIVPATEELRQLLRGDYLFAQLTLATLLGGGASDGDGLTLDVHFTGDLRLPS